jgi:5-methylcytosine-specific restriction endonuclease McrA
MTEAQFISFIKSALRSKSRFWKPLSDVLKKAHVSRGVYLCNVCQQKVPVSHVVNGKRRKFVQVDHIKPVVSPETGFVDWNQFIENLFCEEDNLQVICSNCHDEKSKQERASRPNKKKEPNGDEI